MAESSRLAKVIAQSGLCSRRAASRLISAGQVSVNGKIALHHQDIAPIDVILVNGNPLAATALLSYWLYHKPIGIDCNNRIEDPCSIVHLLQRLPTRLFAVGRLDKDSRGLLLLTNDGALTQRLLHPQYAHQKQYCVTVDKPLPETISLHFAKGISWQVGPHSYQAKPCTAIRLNDRQLAITLTEGQHRQIRYMCRSLGFNVIDLCRTAIGGLTLGELAAGDTRQLAPAELDLLLSLPMPQQPT